VTKKEVVATLRKAFNSWASSLPDIEYKSCNDAAEFYDDDANVNSLHVLELAAEQSEQEGGEK
jgi:hypothetical protein